jgi:hypothetical protein
MAVQARTCQLKPKIGNILGTTRPTRFSEKAAQWLANIAKQRDDAEFEVVDLRNYPMPFFEEERSPMFAPTKSAVALRWGKKMAELDGYIFVTAEYNHGLLAVRLCLCRIQPQAGYIHRLWKCGSRTSGGAVTPGSCGTAGGHAEAHCSCQRRRIIGMLIHGKTLPISPISASPIAARA